MHCATADNAPAKPPTNLPHKRSGYEVANEETTDPNTNRLAVQQMVHLRPHPSTTIPKTNNRFSILKGKTRMGSCSPMEHTYFPNAFFVNLHLGMHRPKREAVTGI
jgi:hypothetical protein